MEKRRTRQAAIKLWHRGDRQPGMRHKEASDLHKARTQVIPQLLQLRMLAFVYL